MLGILGMFGTVPFVCSSSAVLTFKDVSITHSARYAQHDVIGELPVNEFIGPDRKRVKFNIQLRSQFGSLPMVAVALLDRMLEQGKAQRLLLGPDYLGKFILTSFDEDRQHFNGYGIAIATDVSLSLEQDR